MKDWHLLEVESVLSDDYYRWYPPKQRPLLKLSRMQAFVYRRAHLRKISGNKANKRNSIVGHNKNTKRLARSIITAAKSGKPIDHQSKFSKAVLLSKKKSSLFLDGLYPGRISNWASIAARIKSKSHSAIPIVKFSFLKDAKGTQRNLAKIAEAEATNLTAQIHFLDKHCLDVGAWLVLAAMRKDMAPIFTGGAISNQMSKVLDALGLTGPLRFSVNPKWSQEKDIWAFPIRTRRAAGATKSPTYQLEPQAKEKAGDSLCKAIDEWLHACANQALTKSGRRLVKKITGECLDNAERHARREHQNDGDWMLSGFMQKIPTEEGHAFRCHLAFLSVGSPVAETILDCSDEIRAKMEHYCTRHVGKLSNHKFADQHLRTIYALQDTVTRDRNASEEGRGGTGFRDIICLFWDLAGGEGDAMLSIVSGRTCLYIDNRHRDAVFPEPDDPFNYWLNDHNSDLLPPAEDLLEELDTAFNGTLITMGLTLDVGYLERSADANP